MTQPQFYVVGGAVRDAILGAKPTDIDYLVVGATPEWMLENGYTQVGADFPVFLKNGEEYALARTERKTGLGYHGFEAHAEPDVTLEQDLERRDLTVNSMAVKQEDWDEFLDVCDKHRKSCDFKTQLDDLVFNLKDHIFDKVIMMNGGAFKEDPVRVFRAVRMCYTLPKGEGCTFVADEWDYGARTWKAMEEMVASDDFNHLTPERVAQEVLKTASKCTDLDQFAYFTYDLDGLGAMPAVIGSRLDYKAFVEADLKKVSCSSGLQDREIVAFLMLCLPSLSVAELRKLFHDRRYSNAAVNFGIAVRTFYDAYGVDSKCWTRGLMNAEEYLKTVGSVTRSEVLPACQFLSSLEMVEQNNIAALEAAYQQITRTGIDSLSEEQQKTLSGRAIGEAIHQERVKRLDQELKRTKVQ